jgi:hypothetical protein
MAGREGSDARRTDNPIFPNGSALIRPASMLMILNDWNFFLD